MVNNRKNPYGYWTGFAMRLYSRPLIHEWIMSRMDVFVDEWREYHEQIMYPYDRDHAFWDAYDWNHERVCDSLVGFFLPDGF